MVKMRNGLLVLTALAVFSTSAAAGPNEDLRAAVAARDFGKAVAILQPLANTGDPIGQYLLGGFYEKGLGVAKDPVQAVAWFRKAAEQGHTGAQAKLGISYTLGQGVAQHDGQAFQWLSKASERGEGSGMLFLGTAYALGKGTARDHVQAHKWISLAISRLQDPSLRDRAIALRDTVAGGMTPTQIAEAQRLAAAWQSR